MNRSILGLLFVLLSAPSHAFDAEESDKQRHIALTALIFGSAYAITEDATTSALIAFGSGLVKEVFDDRNGYGIDPQDLRANAVGLGIGFLWVYKFK